MQVRDGRLGIGLFDDEYIQDPYPLYERMHACGPVHPIEDSGFYAVCGWDAINDVIARPGDFSSNLTATMTYQDGKVGEFVMGELGGDIIVCGTRGLGAFAGAFLGSFTQRLLHVAPCPILAVPERARTATASDREQAEARV